MLQQAGISRKLPKRRCRPHHLDRKDLVRILAKLSSEDSKVLRASRTACIPERPGCCNADVRLSLKARE
eukprot:753424-Hanusia_phi.AAC.1